MIFVNFKTYEQGSAESALSLVSTIEEVSQSTQIKIIPVVQVVDAVSVVKSFQSEVWVQHVDPIEYGAHTGWILPETVVTAGIYGTFLNHSEHKLSFEVLKLTVERCKSLDLKTLIFASNLDELRKVLELSPTYVSYEPSELVGSTTTSVAEAKSEIIGKAAELSKTHGIALIVGAGIHSKKDVSVSVALGATGIAVATNIVKAEDPKIALTELAEGFGG